MFKFIFFIAIALNGVSHGANETETEWSESSNKDDIATYYRKIPGSPVYALKGNGNFNIPLWKLASVLLDSTRGTEWIDSLVETKMLKRLNPFSYIEYNHIRTPFVLKDREFVTQINIQINEEKKTFEMTYQPGPQDLYPETKNVRGEIVYGRLALTSLESGKSSRIEGELHCDPKGAVPKWIVNLFQKGWPRKTLEGVRKQALKPDIALPEEFKEILEKTVSF